MPGNGSTTTSAGANNMSQLENLSNVTTEVINGVTIVSGEGYASMTSVVPEIPPTQHIYRTGDISFFNVLVKPGLMYHKITLTGNNDIRQDMIHSYVVFNDIEILIDEYDDNRVNIFKYDNETESYDELSFDDMNTLIAVAEQQNDIEDLEVPNKLIRDHYNTSSIEYTDELYSGKNITRKVVDNAQLAGSWQGEMDLVSADARIKI